MTTKAGDNCQSTGNIPEVVTYIVNSKNSLVLAGCWNLGRLTREHFNTHIRMYKKQKIYCCCLHEKLHILQFVITQVVKNGSISIFKTKKAWSIKVKYYYCIQKLGVITILKKDNNKAIGNQSLVWHRDTGYISHRLTVSVRHMNAQHTRTQLTHNIKRDTQGHMGTHMECWTHKDTADQF